MTFGAHDVSRNRIVPTDVLLMGGNQMEITMNVTGFKTSKPPSTLRKRLNSANMVNDSYTQGRRPKVTHRNIKSNCMTENTIPPDLENLRSKEGGRYKKRHQDHTKDNTREPQQETSVPPSAKGYIRFLHLNTGGIHPKEGYAEYRVLLNNITLTQADVYGINEHFLDTSQPQIKRDLHDAGKAINKYSTQIFGTSDEPFPNKYKPGGTMIGITGNTSGRIEGNGIDSKGRWT